MKVVCAQTDIVWEDKAANFAHVRALLDKAEMVPGSLIVLPEMFATGFSMNSKATVDNGETCAFLVDLAKRHRSSVMGGLVERGRVKAGRNTLLAVDAHGKILSRYCKMFPFRLGGERDAHDLGEEVVTFTLEVMTVAPFICYDLRFPEIFRTASAKGAELMVVIANWPSKRVDHWVTLLRARAIENLTYVIGVNRSGKDPFHEYPGRTLIIDPHGRIMADAGANESVITADIDPEVVRNWRKEFPALRDRRDIES